MHAPACILAAGALAASPVIGPQVRVDLGGGTAAANETTASSSELSPGRIIVGWNDYRDGSNIRAAFGVSFDGGATWVDVLMRPPAPFQSAVEGDPMVAHDDRTGTMWFGAISFAGNGGLFVGRLDPDATELGPAVMADVGFVDKGWMAAGPRFNEPDTTRVYCTYNLGVTWSDTMGDTWSDPVSLGAGLGFLPRIGPAGELYVAYWDGAAGVMLKRSLDNGATFTTHAIATRMDVWQPHSGDRFPGIFRVPPLTYLDVDPHSGALYAVYFDTTDFVDGNANVDVYFTRSDDQGSSWTVPVVINGDGNPPGDQFFPWIEVDRQGRIHVTFLDSRNVAQDDNDANGFFDTYYLVSEDGGATWDEFRLTPETWGSFGSGFIGDYTGGAAAGRFYYPSYIDMHEGDQNIYVHAIEFTCPWDCGDFNGTVGIIDFLALLAQWGQTGPCDFDLGGVEINDFLELLGNWGACP